MKPQSRLRRRVPLVSVILAFLSCSAAVASEWYIRGGLGYERSKDANFSDVNCASTAPPALFGCVSGNDGKSIGAYGDFGGGMTWDVAVGRRILPWLRGDLSVSYRPDLDFDGNANFLRVGNHQPVAGEMESWAGMVNLFADLQPLTDVDLGVFEPYVGVGMGVSRNDLGRLRFSFPENPGRHRYSIVPSGESWNFAYTLAIGTGISLDERTTLDIALRYSDLGKVRSDRGRMVMNTLPAGIRIDQIETSLRTHGVSVGLRYRF